MGTKVKNTKRALQDWVRIKEANDKKVAQELAQRMEETHISMETTPISPTLLVEEQGNFMEYQKVLRVEEENWRLKSRSLWLQVGIEIQNYFTVKPKPSFGKIKSLRLGLKMEHLFWATLKSNHQQRPISKTLY
jgi:hypothetical protein